MIAIAIVTIILVHGSSSRTPGPATERFPGEPACAPDAIDGGQAGSAGELAEPSPDGPVLGVNDSAYLSGRLGLQATLQLDRELGATLWRLPLDWGGIEQRPGKFDFSRYDPVYCAAIAGGVAPIWHLTGIPTRISQVPCKGPCLHPPPGDHLDDLRRFATLAAIRYPRSAAFEGWNEPNLASFWGGPPNPARYVKVLRATYEGVKDANPAMPVLGGSLLDVKRDGEHSLSLDTFLGQMVEAGGLDYLDGFSLHPYPYGAIGSSGDRFTPTLNATEAALGQAGRADLPIWITEIGAPTARGAFAPPVTLAGQAAVLAAAYREARRSGRVAAFVVHTLLDPETNVLNDVGFGLFTQPDEAGVVRAKPAACALRQLASAQSGCPEGLAGPVAGG